MRFVTSFLSAACLILATGLVSFFAPVASGQTNMVPVGTSENRYVLSIQNKFPWTLDSIHVKVISSPQWTTFRSSEAVIDSIPPKQFGEASLEFSVSDVQAGLSDSLRLIVTDRMGYGFDTRTVSFTTEVPAIATGMDAAYPNPSNPSTTISYQLSALSDVKLKVYDMLGREVAVLVNEKETPGLHTVKFVGSKISSGIYFLLLETPQGVLTSKIALIK